MYFVYFPLAAVHRLFTHRNIVAVNDTNFPITFGPVSISLALIPEAKIRTYLLTDNLGSVAGNNVLARSGFTFIADHHVLPRSVLDVVWTAGPATTE